MTRLIYPEGEVYAPDLVLTPEQIKAAHAYLLAGIALAKKEKELHKLLPENINSEFFGEWNILKLRTIEDDNLVL